MSCVIGNCPYCGARGCFEFVKNEGEYEVQACCSCGQEIKVKKK